MQRATVRHAAMLSPALMLVGMLLVVPVGYLLRYSVAGGEAISDDPVEPLSAYRHILGDAFTLGIIGRTFLISATVTLVCLIAGLPLANLIWRCAPRWRHVVTLVVLSPLLVSVVVSAYGWVVLLGSKGLINNALLALGLVG